MKLLIASGNPAKIEEIKKYLKNLPLGVLTPKDLNIHDSVEETGQTFLENAILKAKHFAKLSGLLTLADDGGLEIDYLDGAPRVKSRRWLGYEMSDEELIDETLKRMNGVPKEKRTAALRMVLALASPEGKIWTSEGTVKGLISEIPSPKRIKGYPYRSFFYFPQFKKFYIDLNEEEHAEVNQRKAALEKLKPIIISQITKRIKSE
jgi:XTP/dITP diphosphohydrolase